VPVRTIVTSTIVRVEAGRLRRRLIEYYADEGSKDPLRIEIPKGAYVPTFAVRSGAHDGSDVPARPAVEMGRLSRGRWPSIGKSGILAALLVIAVTSWIGWRAMEQSIAPEPAETARVSSPTVFPAIVVMPFADETGTEEGNSLATGLTEDIVTDLSKMRGVDVIALSSARLLENQSIGPGAIGEKLGVTHVLRGSVRGQAPKHRITAQLYETRTNRQVWAERFDRDFGNELKIQDELATRVVRGVSEGLAARQSGGLSARRLVTDEARALYRQAMDLVNPPNDVSRLLVARQAFERAIEIDAGYSNAYAGLAYSYVFAVLFGHSASVDADLQAAATLAQRALNGDSTAGLAYTTLAFVELIRENYGNAVALSGKALIVQPGDPYINAYHAYLLAANGQAAAAVEYAEQALRLDPLNVRSPYMNILGYVSFYAGDYQNSLDAYLGSRRRGGPATPGHQAHIVACNAALGRYDEAGKQLAILDSISENDGWADGPLAHRFRRTEDREKLAIGIAELRDRIGD